MGDNKNVRLLRPLLIVGGAALLLGLNVPAASATQDPLWLKQYGPVQIGAPTAWQKSTGKGVKVAVIDSGVDVDHPDLKANLLLADSHDFACDDDNPDDDATTKDTEGKDIKGHGTHVTGTIAAVANNSIGVAGVAPDVKVMVEKVFETNGACQSAGLGGLTGLAPTAIRYAVDHGAKVINLSLDEHTATSNLTGDIQSACNTAFTRGTLCVVSAGNAGQFKPSGYDYDFNGMIVTANDSNGNHASFGQMADTKWGVSAPGVGILNTWPIDDPGHDGYNSIQGTSMAAPHVAGAAAVLFGMGMNAREVAETLVRTAGPARDTQVEGAGLIHLDRAAGLETTATTTLTNRTPVTVNRAPRPVPGGGGAAIVTTSTSTPGPNAQRGDFEEGLATDDSSNNDFGELQLKQASRNAANKPFNATWPLAGASAVVTLVTLGLAIPRLRSKDTPLT